ncbi:MAG: HAMP domain-containing protein [Anaerolineales bacterium]|nr:HAMP domain-containing protein [Anaerolineales bacterium]
MSIRLKVALPFVLLTVVVSLIGVYVVTRLVTGSMTERLTNQLLEAGRVVSDSFIRQEGQHVLEAQRISYIVGLAEALQDEDREAVLELAEPSFGAGTIENLILVSPQGNEIVHLLRDEMGELQRVYENTGASSSPIVAPFLRSRNPADPPHRALGGNLVNNELYYYTALPVAVDGEFYGVIVVGTSINTLLPIFKHVALADIVLYGNNGQALATTLGSADEKTLEFLTISEQEYQSALTSPSQVNGVNFELAGRNYTLGRAPLQVGNDRVGVFGVALPTDFVIQFGANNRTTYAALFTVVMLVVIAIGYFVSRMIIVPLYSLVTTSQAIAGGDLARRTGIRTGDEIGTLASTFDVMTSRLQDRTEELERMNEVLKKMDRTKTNFIQISAHELRTPLTLIMGYSQMLEQDTKDFPEMQKLAQGILEGSERMSDVVDSMLDVSRIDSNALVLRKASTQMEPIIRKVQKGFSSAFAERNIKFGYEGLDKLPAIVADPELLYKVFYHLVMNAIKFTPDGGEVKVTGRYMNGSEPPQLEIAVHDTGVGVDTAMKERIFEKFGQTGEVLLHSSGKTKFKGGGPGLGLAIARGIVHAHGGQIWVDSPGYNETTLPGSTFRVSLPAQNEKERAP